MGMDPKSIREAAEALKPWLVETRRHIHMNPELGLEERQTADFIQATLSSLGIESERKGTAVVGLVRGKLPGGVVALRADIDALPLDEANEVEYKSRRPGAMHACGHDAHATILLGAARFFAERRDALRGTIKLLFQPAEETVGGAATMISSGCLENPRVDYVLGLHVMPYLPVGVIEAKKGALNGSSCTLRIAVRGKGAHGAYPDLGIDAVLAASSVVVALNSVVSRNVSPLESAVLTVGTIRGGKASNVIADEVRMEATLRSTSPQVRDAMIARIKAIVEGVPASFGGSGELEVEYGYEALINDDASVDVVVRAAEAVLGPGSIRWKEKPSMGVEDFSFFLKERPGAFYHLGCGNEERGIRSPLHSNTFDIDEDCLPLGVAIQAAAALEFLRLAGKGERE